MRSSWTAEVFDPDEPLEPLERREEVEGLRSALAEVDLPFQVLEDDGGSWPFDPTMSPAPPLLRARDVEDIQLSWMHSEALGSGPGEDY